MAFSLEASLGRKFENYPRSFRPIPPFLTHTNEVERGPLVCSSPSCITSSKDRT